MMSDHYWEYLNTIDELLHEFVQEVNRKIPEAFLIDGISVEKGMIDWMWEELMYQKCKRDWYNEQRHKKVSKDHLKKELHEWLREQYLPSPLTEPHYHPTDREAIQAHPWNKSLSGYSGKPLILCRNLREWHYWLPLLKKWRKELIVCLSFDLPEETEFEEEVILIEYCLPNEEVVFNDYLKQQVPLLFHFPNMNALLLDILRPSCVLVLTGCNLDAEILAVQCKRRRIPSICMQQGWPSIMHTKFREMKYDYFLTWGKAFNALWAKYNATPRFIDTGYIYPVLSGLNKATGITFWLQTPIIVLNSYYLEEMYKLALYCAEKYPERTIYLRTHPSARPSEIIRKRFLTVGNIQWADEYEPEEVFARTEISVAAWSSTLIESLLHGAVPFIFDPSSVPHYYPDLESKKIGMESKTLKKAKEKIDWLVENLSLLQEKGQKTKPSYFTAWGDQAISRTIRSIETIISGQIC